MWNPTIDRIPRYALAGAIAGLIVFMALNPSYSRQEALPGRFTGIGEALVHVWTSALIFGMVIGLCIGCCLVLAEELGTWNLARLKRYLPISAGVGLLGGAIAGTVAQFTFSVLLIISIVMARTVGWCLMGAGAGVCVGAAYADSRKAVHGAVGGAIGGWIGGFLFDALGTATGGGSASRFVGFIAMGVAIGAAVALVEEIAKSHWVSILTGSREGRSYIISKPETTIGRNELADIPLFGDQNVGKLHAKLVRVGPGVSIIAQGGQIVTVNSTPAASAMLSDGDIIGIGSHKIRFSTKARGLVPSVQPVTPPQPIPNVPPAIPSQPSVLSIVSGPHAGQTYTLAPGSIVLGRDTNCAIQLPQDGMVSRNHARLTWDGAALRIQDLGSTNGLFVNGQRVTDAVLSLGDTVGLGQTTFKVG